MKNDDFILNSLEKRRTYSHRELLNCLRQARPGLADGSYHWITNRLIRDGKLLRKGYDAYSLSDGEAAKEYNPYYSDEAKRLMEDLSTRFPAMAFIVFETALMNDFLNHLIAQNAIFVQVEKESSIYVFRYFQDKWRGNVLYKPSVEDMALYWSKGCLIVTDLVSEAPQRAFGPHAITLEKMLVDMIADKLISAMYGKAEYPDVIEQAKSRYLLDEKRMLRYARRRNRYKEISQYLAGGTGNAEAR